MADDDYSRSRLPSTYARLSGGSTKKKKNTNSEFEFVIA